MQLNNEFEYFEETKQLLYNGILVASVGSILAPLSSKYYKDVPEKFMKAGQDKGKAVHEAIELFLKTQEEKIDNKYRDYFIQFKKWYDKNCPNILGIEEVVYTNRFWGIADLICDIKGKKYIIDIKTNSQFNTELTSLQITGYKIAYESMNNKIDGIMGLHLSKTKYNVHYLNLQEDRFLSLVDEYEEMKLNSY